MQRGEGGFQGVHLGEQRLVGLGRPPALVGLALHGGQISEHQLELEHAEVLDRIGSPDHVVIGERPQDQTHGVGLPDSGEKPVAQTLTRRRPRHQPGDVDHLDGGVHHLAALAHLGQGVEAAIIDLGHAHVGLGRREGVGGDRRVAPGEGIEQAGLACVGKADEAQTFHRSPRLLGPVRLRVMSKRTKKAKTRAHRNKANHGRKPNRGR